MDPKLLNLSKPNDLEIGRKQLRQIYNARNSNLISVFSLEKEDGRQDIEMAILKAFIDSKNLKKNKLSF
jgi:hypothetical protein